MNDAAGRAVADGRASSRSSCRSPSLPPGEYVVEITDRRAGRGREGARRLPRDRLMHPGGVVAAASIALAIGRCAGHRQRAAAASKSAIRSRDPQSAIRNPRSQSPVPGCSPSTSARPTRAAAPSTTSSRPISSCAQRARSLPLASVRLVRAGGPSGDAAGAIETAADERQAAQQRRRAAVRDFSRRVSRRQPAPTATACARRCCVSSIAT